MTPALLGKKIGMTRIYDDKGAVVPVTIVEVGTCNVTQVKTPETDGYFAVQVGGGEIHATGSAVVLAGLCHGHNVVSVGCGSEVVAQMYH